VNVKLPENTPYQFGYFLIVFFFNWSENDVHFVSFLVAAPL
jgi:hypothetical protein